jgi:hypothetical protein
MSKPEHSRRPALVKLTNDLETLREELLTGFESRAEIIWWSQRLSVRTLGQLPDRWFDGLGAQFRGIPSSNQERTLISALLVDRARERDISSADARELRERLYALTIRPAFHRAFRHLRADAGEYLDDEGGTSSQHTAARQRWIAMRPALDELEHYQQTALEALLGDRGDDSDPGGLEDKSEIIRWGSTLELATHGELPGEFIGRAYREESTVDVLTGDDETSRRARELFWAVHLAPCCNRGVRDLSGRTSEQPDAERKDKQIPTA